MTVVLGTTLNSRDALLLHLWVIGFGQQLAPIVTAGLCMMLGLRMGLAPLLRLRDAVLARPSFTGRLRSSTIPSSQARP